MLRPFCVPSGLYNCISHGHVADFSRRFPEGNGPKQKYAVMLHIAQSAVFEHESVQEHCLAWIADDSWGIHLCSMFSCVRLKCHRVHRDLNSTNLQRVYLDMRKQKCFTSCLWRFSNWIFSMLREKWWSLQCQLVFEDLVSWMAYVSYISGCLGWCQGNNALLSFTEAATVVLNLFFFYVPQIALRWLLPRSMVRDQNLTADMVDNIPGYPNDRKTPFGELNWIFTAITDTIAWNVLPRELFQKLFRQVLLNCCTPLMLFLRHFLMVTGSQTTFVVLAGLAYLDFVEESGYATLYRQGLQRCAWPLCQVSIWAILLIVPAMWRTTDLEGSFSGLPQPCLTSFHYWCLSPPVLEASLFSFISHSLESGLACGLLIP